jgi:hypothetical protein
MPAYPNGPCDCKWQPWNQLAVIAEAKGPVDEWTPDKIRKAFIRFVKSRNQTQEAIEKAVAACMRDDR